MGKPINPRYYRDRWTHFRAQGLCGKCGRPSQGLAYCRQCRKNRQPSNNAHEKRKREQRLLRGVCISCGKRKPAKSTTRCGPCNKRLTTIGRNRRATRKAKGLCVKCGTPSVPGLTRCQVHRVLDSVTATAAMAVLRHEAIMAYGGYKCNCPGCTVTIPEFLHIDHINNDGAQHRKTFKTPLYRWLKTHGYPPGFQVLCVNCNFAKSAYGACPHLKSLEVKRRTG